MKGNREYKDRLFKFLFGSEDRKENTLELYNALSGSSYTDTTSLELTTIEDTLYLGMRNDLSFIVADWMVLFEQESTYDPNMPLRGLMYFGKQYSRYVEQESLWIYGSTLLRLPTPRFVVFYNGPAGHPGRERLQLAEAFEHPEQSDVNVTATMININSDSGDEILQRSRVLREYALFVAEVRKQKAAGQDLTEAINGAIDRCLEEGILEDVLRRSRAEVFEMIFEEYDEAKAMEMSRKEGYREGYEAGERNGYEAGERNGYEAGERNGYEAGERNGYEAGEKQTRAMMQALWRRAGADSRQAEFLEAMEDEAKLEALLKEYGISEEEHS